MGRDETLHSSGTVLAEVILAEYSALREELMYFLLLQRRSLRLLTTTSVGQIGGLLLNSTNIISTKSMLTPEVLIIFYLFVLPLIIGLLFISSLDHTSRVIIIADYIHKGIKPQLQELLGKKRFFEWEEHKASTKRIPRIVIEILDGSKWLTFIFGLFVSLMSGIWIQYSTKVLSHSHIKIAFSMSIIITTLLILLCVRSALLFNEAEGESIIKTLIPKS